MKQKHKIGLLVEGWGGVAVVNGLMGKFALEICTQDSEIIGIGNKRVAFKSSIEEMDSETIICAGYRNLVSLDMLEKHDFLNIHYSLLPKYRGMHSTAWAILNEEKYLGFTIHKMSRYIDDGPVIFQKRILNDGESSLTYYMELMNNMVKESIANILKRYLTGEIVPIPQDKSIASWVPKRGQFHNQIPFERDIRYIKNLFRILQPPYPDPFFHYRGKLYYVKKARVRPSDVYSDESRIVNIDDEGIWVHAKDGYVIIEKVVDCENKLIDFHLFRIGSWLNNRGPQSSHY